jgi:hypothetical protein
VFVVQETHPHESERIMFSVPSTHDELTWNESMTQQTIDDEFVNIIGRIAMNDSAAVLFGAALLSEV